MVFPKTPISYKLVQLIAQAVNIHKEVKIPAPFEPRNLPKTPEIIELINGKKINNRYINA